MFATKVISRAIVAAAAFGACAAFAADTGTLAVSATVKGTCKLTSVPPMSFTLDPSIGGDVTQTSDVQYKCTKGTAPASNGFTVGGVTSNYSGTLAATATGNTDSIAVGITWTAPSTAGNGLGASVTPVTVRLTGTILAANYLNVTADTYKQDVQVSINP
jgi:spore coat protein U-like protein